MKVTVEDILKIRRGKSKTFILDRPSDCHTAISLVSYVKKVRKPMDISDYTTATDWKTNAITITAL